MLKFKCNKDLSQLSDKSPSFPIVQENLYRMLHPEYQPEADGWVLLIEPPDSYEKIINDYTLIDVPWEAVTLQQGHYICAYVPNNQFVLIVIVQCDDWMDYELKGYLDDHLDF